VIGAAQAARRSNTVHPDDRPLAVWTNAHDNGWVANAVEMPDGTFAAWAAPDATATGTDYIEDGPENAKAGRGVRARAQERSHGLKPSVLEPAQCARVAAVRSSRITR
jgi:hypothetical protein